MRPLILKLFDIVRIYYTRHYLLWLTKDYGEEHETLLLRQTLFDMAYDGICMERLMMMAECLYNTIRNDVVEPNPCDDFGILGKHHVRDYVLGFKAFNIDPRTQELLTCYVATDDVFRDGMGLTRELHENSGVMNIVTTSVTSYPDSFLVEYK